MNEKKSNSRLDIYDATWMALLPQKNNSEQRTRFYKHVFAPSAIKTQFLFSIDNYDVAGVLEINCNEFS